jgi:hypothetical protein
MGCPLPRISAVGFFTQQQPDTISPASQVQPLRLSVNRPEGRTKRITKDNLLQRNPKHTDAQEVTRKRKLRK